MSTLKSRDQCINENMDIFLNNGPRVSSSYNVWIEKRCPNRGKVLLGGLGVLGVGQMWVKEESSHKDYPNYEEAIIVDEI